jgi:pyruvate kinase
VPNALLLLPLLLLLLLLQVAATKGKLLSYALDTKGPEIRTAMLKGGQDIMLNKGARVQQGSCCSEQGHGMRQIW